MKSYLIWYGHKKTGLNYNKLITQIQKFSDWRHCLESVWIVKSDLTADLIVEILKAFIDTNTELLVVHLGGDTAWIGFESDCSLWLRENI